MKTPLPTDIAEKAHAFILSALASGKTVYLTNALHVRKITPKAFASWQSEGLEMFRLRNGTLYVASGKRFNCIATPTVCLVKISAR